MSLLTAQLVPILVILLLTCFIAMALAIRHYFQHTMMNTMRHLKAQSAENDKIRAKLAAQAVALKQETEAVMARAQAEAEALRAQGRDDVAKARQEALDQARQESERIVQQAMQARNALVHEVTQFTESRVIKRASQLLQAVCSGVAQQALHQRWVDELIQDGFLSAEHLRSAEPVTSVRVVTALPLTPAQREQLLARLQAALGTAVTVDEVVDAKLVAGLTITVGHTVLDGSLASKLREAAQHAHDTAE